MTSSAPPPARPARRHLAPVVLAAGLALLPAQAHASAAALESFGDDLVVFGFLLVLLGAAAPDLHFEWSDDTDGFSTVTAWGLPITWVTFDVADDVDLGVETRIEGQHRAGVDARGLAAIRLPVLLADEDFGFGVYAEGGGLFGGDGRAWSAGGGLFVGHLSANLAVGYRQHFFDDVRRSIGVEFNLGLPVFYAFE